MKKKYSLLLLITLLFACVFTTGFTRINTKPKTLYRVYLKGESLGLIESNKSFEEYIDDKQDNILK